MGIKAHFDLLSGILFCGKVWQIVLGKIIETRGFQIFLKAAANQRAKNKNFAYTIGIYWKIVFCSILNGSFQENLETTGFDYFNEDSLPELATEKNTAEQIKMCFDAHRSGDTWKTLFD